jgi:hypothetical protein
MSADFEVTQAPDELARRKIGAVTLASLFTTAVALAVAWVLLGHWGEPPRSTEPPPAPRTIGILEQSLILHTDRGVELRKEQAASLEQWAWADRDAGVARIPITTAIEIFAASPLPPDQAISPKKEAPR